MAIVALFGDHASAKTSGDCFADMMATAGVPKSRAAAYEKKFHRFHVKPGDLYNSRELLLVVLGVNILSDRQLISNCFRKTPVGAHAKRCKLWRQCSGHGSCVTHKTGYQCQCDPGYHGMTIDHVKDYYNLDLLSAYHHHDQDNYYYDRVQVRSRERLSPLF